MLHCNYKQHHHPNRICYSILHITRNFYIYIAIERKILFSFRQREKKKKNRGDRQMMRDQRKMASTKFFLLVLWLAVCVGMCRSWGENVAEDTKAKAEEAKQFAASTVHDAKEKTESLADWARDTFSQNFVSENAHEKQVTDQNINYKDAEDAASRATETMKSAASRASDYASQKVTDTKEAISGAMAYGGEKASEAYHGGDEIIRMPTDRDVAEAKDTVGEAMGQAKERVQDTYEDAKQKLHTASDKASNMAFNAKDNMAESMRYGRDRAASVYDMTSEKFYDAKDKASDVYDEARNKMSDMASSGINNDGTDQRIKMASQKMYDVKDKVKGAMDYGKDKAFDAYEEAKEGMNMAGDKASDARDKVDETFDRAKQEVGDAYMTAKNSMTGEAKAKHEAAKEKASEATGNLGAKMRNSPEI